MSWTQIIKFAHRKEPLSNFVLIVGSVDAVIGGVSNHGLLLTLGMSMIGVAIALRWQAFQRQQALVEPSRYSLRSAEPPPLPLLDRSQQPGTEEG
ncbi:MAG TPA: hypothetical protein V6C57_05525 [Coleofasciculaceae cyanobacterium]